MRGAFLFDLDGTLVDTESIWSQAIVAFVNERGGATTLADILPRVIGRNWFDIDAALHERFPCLGDTSPMEDAVALRRHYNALAVDPATLRIEGSVAFFRAAARIAPCAVVSGSPHDDIVAALHLCGLEDVTTLVLGAGEYRAGKPDPSGYLCAAVRLGLSPKDCIVVEDSEVGVAAGVAAGMRVVALDRARLVPQRFVGETWRVGNLSELNPEEML